MTGSSLKRKISEYGIGYKGGKEGARSSEARVTEGEGKGGLASSREEGPRGGAQPGNRAEGILWCCAEFKAGQ